ncbi:hypothetical protein V6N13_080615 [Hibiscus sabdariffa]|uniref:Uncharacterized protein n=1 Tax=Hibiscus sabdariffa TaxID=183260 RepID=A0ABR2BG48_9ROSI
MPWLGEWNGEMNEWVIGIEKNDGDEYRVLLGMTVESECQSYSMQPSPWHVKSALVQESGLCGWELQGTAANVHG